MPGSFSSPPIAVLVVAGAATTALVTRQLRDHDVEILLADNHGKMAALLSEPKRQVRGESPFFFVLDLRLACGTSVIDARLADYDSALSDHLRTGQPWPQTLCLVDAEQTHPRWLHARPHLRATLLADEVHTVIHRPTQRGWHETFSVALGRCVVGACAEAQNPSTV